MLYVCYNNLNENRLIGVKKKIIGQTKAFGKAFEKAFYTIYSGQTIYLFSDKGELKDKKFALTINECNKVIIYWIEKCRITKIYIRNIRANKALLNFLAYLKENNIKTVLEIPTYPYDLNGIRTRVAEDQYYRDQLHYYVGCCTTYAKYDTVFGIPCIPLVNGIDVDVNKMKEHTQSKWDITLIGVANMMRGHGYERIIQGMQEYYQGGDKRKVYFKLVGDGSQIPYYERLVKEYHLEKYVEFCGVLHGDGLDKAYEEADIGIGSVGSYKDHMTEGAGIKVYEYCVRGIPMIYDTVERALDEKYFVMKVVSDKSPIDIRSILNFYDSLQDKNYIEEMHDYAVKNFTWDKLLEPVIEYYNSNGR